MKTRRGFTLIEVMVVLSLLAMITVLAYNFFGNTMREARLRQAATKFYNDFRILSDAMDEFYRRNGRLPTAAEVNGDKILVTSGILKAMPTPDLSWKDSTDYGAASVYEWSSSYDNMDGVGAHDSTWLYYYVPNELCAEFNSRYAAPPLDDGTVFDYQAAGSQYPGENLGRHHRVYGIKWVTTDSTCELEWVTQYND